MARRTYLLLGSTFVVMMTGFFYLFGAPTGDPLIDVAAGAVLLTGVLFVLGGFRAEYAVGPIDIRWNHLIGAGDVLLAVALALNGVDLLLSATDPTTYAVAALVVLAAAIVGWIGYDFLRGGVYLDLSRYEE